MGAAWKEHEPMMQVTRDVAERRVKAETRRGRAGPTILDLHAEEMRSHSNNEKKKMSKITK